MSIPQRWWSELGGKWYSKGTIGLGAQPVVGDVEECLDSGVTSCQGKPFNGKEPLLRVQGAGD